MNRADGREAERRAETHDLDVAIVGGGIAGLVTAHRLNSRPRAGRPRSVCLFEASDRLGGQVQTEQRGDWLLESGPDAMVTAKGSAIDLCRALGLGDELVPPLGAAPFSVVRNRRLHPLPAGFRTIAPTEPWPLLQSRLFSWPGKLRMLCEPWVSASAASTSDGAAEDETVEGFVVRRFGREVYDRVAEPVLGGLFVADATALSARRVLGPFVELELRNGSVLRGLRAVSATAAGAARGPGHDAPAQLTLKRGLGSLIRRLADEIPASWVQLGCAAKRIERSREGGRWRIETASGTWRSREVVLACPAPHCAPLLHAAAPEVARALEAIRFASCVTVNLVYRRRDLTHLPNEFGFFVPRSESCRILAATFASEKFPARASKGHVVVRTFLGGALDPGAVDLDDATLAGNSHDDLAQLIGAVHPPLSTHVHRFRNAMPQFDVGHLSRVADLRSAIAGQQGLHVVGSGMGGYGLPDCVTSGEAAAEAISRSQRRTAAPSPLASPSVSMS